MVIFLYGDDSYRIREKAGEIIGKYREKNKSGFNFRVFDFREKDGVAFGGFKDNFRQFSMFKEKKLLVAMSPFSDENFKKFFLADRENILSLDDLILIIEEGKIVKSDLMFKVLKEKAKSQEFIPLTGKKLEAWIKKEFEKYEAKAEPTAIAELAEKMGSHAHSTSRNEAGRGVDSWKLNTEIVKLACYAKGRTVQAKDVGFLVKSGGESDIFKTIDAIARKDKKAALSHIHRHIENGEAPLYILSMINYQFRNLLMVKDLMEKRNTYEMIIKKTGIHPFAVKKSYYLAQNFSFSELKNIYRKIFELDMNSKTGKMDAEKGLDLFIAEI